MVLIGTKLVFIKYSKKILPEVNVEGIESNEGFIMNFQVD